MTEIIDCVFSIIWIHKGKKGSKEEGTSEGLNVLKKDEEALFKYFTHLKKKKLVRRNFNYLKKMIGSSWNKTE